MQRNDERSAGDWLAEGNAHYEAQAWNEAGAALEKSLALDARQAERVVPARQRARGTGTRRPGSGRLLRESGRARPIARAGLEQSRRRAAAPWPRRAGRRVVPQAMQADPGLAQACLNLGRLAGTRGDLALAAQCFKAGLDHHPGDPTFEHLSAAATGVSTMRAPEGYVTNLFDSVARQFEHHLVGELEYQVPEALAKLVLPELKAKACVIDLGCGTGLVGTALAAAGRRNHWC
jgi:hypothetical protein